jgi:hypothetical protein
MAVQTPKVLERVSGFSGTENAYVILYKSSIEVGSYDILRNRSTTP